MSTDPAPPSRPSLAIFDIDGVLADVRHRVHHVATKPKDWDAFFAAAVEDPPLEEGLELVGLVLERGHLICYVTGRPERCRQDTLDWFTRHGLPAAPLHMRADSDRRPARITKLMTARRLAREFDIYVFVDDDAAVVASLREGGFPVMHATWMGGGTNGVDGHTVTGTEVPSTPSVQEVLFEAQETEGRT